MQVRSIHDISCRMACWLALFVVAGTGADALAARPRFFFQVRSVQTPAGSAANLKDKARGILVAELRRQPTVAMELGDPPPQGAELEKVLKARKLDGYELVLRVRKSGHELKPPAAGKAFKMLMVEVDVAVDAQKIPGGQMALAGEGNAQVGTEVRAFTEKEKQQLLGEALEQAIKQAVAQSVSKLGTAKTTKPSRKKK